MALPILGDSTKSKGIVVFSGGSAANNLVDVFKKVAERRESSLSYVIPISDNGGSTSELIRVFGGPGKFSSSMPTTSANKIPGIGDLRSTLTTPMRHVLCP